MTPRPGARLRVALASRPREVRDTLFLLAVLAWTLLPQIREVPPWCAALAYAALGWRAWLAWQGRPLPGRGWRLVLLAGAAAGTYLSHQTLLGRAPGLTLLVVLAALKTLELRARRDATVVFFLGFFLVLANFLVSQSLAMGLAMTLSVWALLAALVLAQLPQGRPPIRQAFGVAARLLLTGMPVVVVLFVLFPRLPPLWNVPGATSRTGLSEQMKLGEVAELAQDDRIALRVRFDGPVPPPAQLYFRGPVLSEADGSGWRVRLDGHDHSAPPPPPQPAPRPGQPAPPPRVRYEMMAEPLHIATLPLLESARRSPDPADSQSRWTWLPHSSIWIADRPLTDRLQVRATATLDTPVHERPPPVTVPTGREVWPHRDDPVWQPYLELPPGQHLRTLAWGRELRGIGGRGGPTPPDGARLAQRLLDYISTEAFFYTLTPGPLGRDPVDSFWLDTRAGFCEHYASAFVVLMRGWGVPARIVTGYQGGRVNPVDGVLEVRQADAHAWAEYWHPARGWVRIDPTAAVAPERIERGQRPATRPGLIGRTLNVDPAVAERVRALWSAAEHRWNTWILGYHQQGQRELLQSVGWERPDARTLARVLAGLLGGLALLGALWASTSAWRRQRGDGWHAGYARLCAQLRQRGLAVPGHWPPDTLAEAVCRQWGDAGQPLADALRALAHWRYAAEPAARPALRPLLRAARQAVRHLPR